MLYFSDGEGRTGVFIALDLLVRDGEKFQKICVLDCVETLRKQRDNMVQTQVRICELNAKDKHVFVLGILNNPFQIKPPVKLYNAAGDFFIYMDNIYPYVMLYNWFRF